MVIYFTLEIKDSRIQERDTNDENEKENAFFIFFKKFI